MKQLVNRGLQTCDTWMTPPYAQHLEELLSRVRHRFGLKVICSKIKVMIVDCAGNNPFEMTQIVNCNVVQPCIYLGALISNNFGGIDEVKLRIGITRTAMD